MATEDREHDVGGGLVRLWRWSSAGAFCDRVPIDEAQELRNELTAMGYATWITECGQGFREMST